MYLNSRYDKMLHLGHNIFHNFAPINFVVCFYGSLRSNFSLTRA